MKIKEKYILTPKPAQTPRINGAKVFGVRPKSPFLFKIAATGEKPLKYEADNLPKGLTVHPETGIISGIIDIAGKYQVQLSVSNSHGKTTREFRIICGDQLCLTPPMGWNSWYVYSLWVSQEKIEKMARAMVSSGLIDHGFTFINIDDAWQGFRDKKSKILQPNGKFPNMSGMCDFIHQMGLKIGIYSGPWIATYAGYMGGSIPNDEIDYSEWQVDPKENIEEFQLFGNLDKLRRRLRFFGKFSCANIDAKQFSEWGFDYLKYDWYPNDLPHIEEMQNALKQCPRDIIYSLSNRTPFEIAPQLITKANVWRTTGDIIDFWPWVAIIGFSQDKWAPYAGPGHWNDPDMLQIGVTAHPHKKSLQGFPSHLTPDEQYSQMSLWCLLAAPILLSCDLTQLDEFTLNLLTNDEVLEINQDPLGKQATTIKKSFRFSPLIGTQILMKEMEDCSKAVGFFNLFPIRKTMKITWKEMGISGFYRVRDLWRQQDLGYFDASFSTKVNAHGVILIRLFPKN